jgi:RNase P subunit RPR2
MGKKKLTIAIAIKCLSCGTEHQYGIADKKEVKKLFSGMSEFVKFHSHKKEARKTNDGE